MIGSNIASLPRSCSAVLAAWVSAASGVPLERTIKTASASRPCPELRRCSTMGSHSGDALAPSMPSSSRRTRRLTSRDKEPWSACFSCASARSP